MPACPRRLAIATLVLATMALPARAVVFTEGDLYALGVDETDTYAEQSPFLHVFSDDPSDHAPFRFALATPYSLVSTEVQGGFGWLQVVTAGSASVGPPPEPNQARAGGTQHDVRAWFRDTITIDAPGLTGQPGSALLGVDVSGVLSTGADWFVEQSNASAQGEAAFSFQAGSFETYFQSAVENNLFVPTGASPAEIIDRFLGGTVPFVFGTPFPIDFYVQFTGNTNAGTETEDGQTGATAAATMVADFRNTFTWAGVAELRDANGDLVSVFDVASVSGTDYRNAIVPVPEPGTALPVLAGLALLTRSRRGRSLVATMLVAIAFAAPAHALNQLPEGFLSGVYGQVDVGYEPDDGPLQNVSDERLDPSPVTGGQFSVSVATEAGLSSAATVVGNVGHGFARLDALAIARQQGEGDSDADVYGAAAFSDVLTISAPGLAGTRGTVRLGADVEGGLSAANSVLPSQPVSAYAYGGVLLHTWVDGDRSTSGTAYTIAVLGERETHVSWPECCDLFGGETIETFAGMDVSFEFGTPFSFGFAIEIEGRANAAVNAPGWSTVATFVGDFGSTATWAGILDLRDGTGAQVQEFEVTSLSGTDYRDAIVPVPEPGTALPVLASLAALALRRR